MIGENLKVIRKKWRESQKDFGERFGVGTAAVSKWELGNTEPQLEVLAKLEEWTGIPMLRLYREDISEDEVGRVPGELIGDRPALDRVEYGYKAKIGEMYLEFEKVEKEKVKVFEALQTVIGFLEKNMDKSVYEKEKKAYLDRVSAILSGGK